jgi:hypothetical protein
MRFVCSLSAFLTVCMLAQGGAHAQWTQMRGPLGGDLSALACHGGVVFAGGAAGVYRSADNGDSWIAMNDGLPAWTSVRALAACGDTLFAGTSAGVCRSVPGGTVWSVANSGLPDRAKVTSLFAMGSTLFCCSNGDVYRSTDGAASWSASVTGLPNASAEILTGAGGTMYVGYTGYQVHRLYISRDLGITTAAGPGATWIAAGSGIDRTLSVNAVTRHGDALLAATSIGMLRRDAGAALFMPRNDGLLAATVRSFACVGWTTFGISAGNILRSDDGGGTWYPVVGALPDHACSLLHAHGSLLVAVARDSVFMSPDGGNSWASRSAGLDSTHVTCFLSLGDTLYAGTWNGVYSTIPCRRGRRACSA